MLFWTKFPFVRITICFALGIWTGNLIRLPPVLLMVLWIISCVLFFLASRYLIRAKFRKYNITISSLAFLSLFLFGNVRLELSESQKDKTEKLILNQAIEYYLARVISHQGRSDRYQKIIVKMHLVKSDHEFSKVHAKVLLYIPEGLPFQYGDQLVVLGKPAPFTDPAFPYEFNYKDYMQKRGIVFHHFLKKEDYKLIPCENHIQPVRLAQGFREDLTRKIHKRIGDNRVQALMIALTTGKRDYFDQETYEDFLGAGIVHILAVSGLHVGILYILLIQLTRPLSLSKAGRLIRLIFILPFFLFFAMITGLSPSVLRSVLMFSIMLVGATFDRKTPVLNSAFLSAFLLLCFDPGLLWQVGFQLSYAAVLGILLFQPLLHSMWIPKSRIVHWIWNLATVSSSAQLATLPFSLLYFKQFPTYFLLSNLIAIPFVTLFIPGSILFICSYFLKPLNHVIALTLDLTGQLFIQIIQIINEFPGSLISPINISTTEAVLLLLMVWILFIVLRYRRHRMFRYILFILLIIIIKDASLYFYSAGEKRIQIYSIDNSPIIELIDGHQSLIVVQSLEVKFSEKVRYHTGNYHIHQNLRSRIIAFSNLQEQIPCLSADGGILIFWNGRFLAILNAEMNLEKGPWKNLPIDFLFVLKKHRYELRIPYLLPGVTEQHQSDPQHCKIKKKGCPSIEINHELTCIIL